MQLARWKEARIGCHEVGAVADDMVSLREVDVFTGRPVGDWVHAIALNIGGVNIYGPEKGKINLTYLAPWSPERNIFCAMGYGMFLPPKELAGAAPLVRGMRTFRQLLFRSRGERARSRPGNVWNNGVNATGSNSCSIVCVVPLRLAL